MNNQIKFRQAIFDTNNKFVRFDYWGFVNFDGSFTPPTNPLSQNAETNSQQLIGLKDKNKVEIYRGDIIMDDSGFDIEYYTIIWNSDYAMFDFEPRDCDDNLADLLNVGGLVVGNIFQNPELLEK